MDYILSEKKKDCVFCTALIQPDGPENLVVHRGVLNFVVLNRYPYTSGHLMIVPNAHIDSLELLDEATRNEMIDLAAVAVRVLREEYRPQGFNVGINEGSAAGAGIAEHLHLHVVPRWSGDTNFMSAVAATRVLPENLEDTLQRVTRKWIGLNA
jgi:ATP adenylyltransferase